ncbi:uncharacterized protein B0I36DRAFT_355813 [Microdochium trichocladiopsis]|uniref:Ankyrin repeat-containing domain protein n=1 Tax=Microdochium trichocladiopsis TaxID=1682393 RepID=A0A9P8XUN9_9PEZI|nr:uncharacterized protein B0I36DRAFT_355813 [Microdochium trichocladiopsis]KAH7014629.1 hypothetical protein B0I36DRAFT_355813 [Microdochium trichocladiopsis]
MGQTCLCRVDGGSDYISVFTRDLALVKLFLERGTPVTQPTLIEAIRRSDTVLLSLLLSPPLGHTDPNTRFRQDRVPLDYWASGTSYSLGGDAEQEPWRYTPPLSINVVLDPLMYPLHFACLQTYNNDNYQTIVEMLLDHGADSNARYENGITVLYYVLSQKVDSLAVKLLLARVAVGGDDDGLEVRNPLGMTPLLIAAHMAGKKSRTNDTSHQDASALVAHRLLDLSADPRARDNNGHSILYYLGYGEDGEGRDVNAGSGGGAILNEKLYRYGSSYVELTTS